ncbi:MAG: hypothetical protein ACFFBK_11690 [Promethearchaeota archaeon]
MQTNKPPQKLREIDLIKGDIIESLCEYFEKLKDKTKIVEFIKKK